MHNDIEYLDRRDVFGSREVVRFDLHHESYFFCAAGQRSAPLQSSFRSPPSGPDRLEVTDNMPFFRQVSPRCSASGRSSRPQINHAVSTAICFLSCRCLAIGGLDARGLIILVQGLAASWTWSESPSPVTYPSMFTSSLLFKAQVLTSIISHLS